MIQVGKEYRIVRFPVEKYNGQIVTALGIYEEGHRDHAENLWWKEAEVRIDIEVNRITSLGEVRDELYNSIHEKFLEEVLENKDSFDTDEYLNNLFEDLYKREKKVEYEIEEA